MRNFLTTAAAIVAITSGLISHAAEKPKTTSPVREIFVPFDELDVLLEGPTRRVLMSRTEYDALVKKARRTPTDVVPQQALLLAAEYDLTIDNLRAEIKAKLTCEVLAEGLHALPLDLHDVGIRDATLDGKAAALGRGDDGRPTLFVAGKGRHTITLTLVTPLETNAAQQMLNLQLPRLPASRLRVTAPGNVEVRGGANVIQREVDEAAGVTRLELVPVDGRLSLTLSLNNRRRSQQRVVVARSVLVDEVTAAYERLHATVSLSILHQAVDRFRFALPDGFEVAEVQSPALSRWSTTTDAGRKVLEVILRQETTETVVLNISAVRSPARLEAWKFPNLEPLEVAGSMSVVGLLLEDRLRVEDVTSDGLLPIDTGVLSRALPASVFAAEPGAPQVRTIVSYYSPDGAVDLTARFTRPESQLRVTSNLLLTLKERGLEVRGGFALAPEAEALHEFDFSVPAGWHVVAVTTAGDVSLPFERYGAADAAGRIHVRLPTKIAVGTPQSVFFQAARTPDGWLNEWTNQSVEFPKFAVNGATVDVGALAVAVEDDFAVRPDVLTNVTPLDEAEKPKYGLTDVATQSAYRYDAADYRAVLTVERKTPRATARTFSFLKVEPDVLTAHYEVIYDVTRARTRRLSFTLPKSSPATISVRLLDGRALKEYASEEVETERRWNVLLADAAQGRVRVAVDFQQPLPTEEVKSYLLPTIRADDVTYQSGIVAVEGSAEIDVQVVKHPRKVDVGELVDAEYQTGRRLLGAFGFSGDEPGETLDVVRHPQYLLHPARVQQAQYVTLLGVNGRAQTSADLRLRTKAGFLEVKLPAGSTLWSAVLDGRPAQPQREGDSLLLSFPSTAGEAIRTLAIVYETPVSPVASLGRVEIPALALFLRSAAGAAATEVPTADVRWTLHLPPGYRVLRSSGTVTAEGSAGRTSPLAATRVAEMIVAATGGFGSQVKSAREMARGKISKGAGALSSYPAEPLGDKSSADAEFDDMRRGGEAKGDLPARMQAIRGGVAGDITNSGTLKFNRNDELPTATAPMTPAPVTIPMLALPGNPQPTSTAGPQNLMGLKIDPADVAKESKPGSYEYAERRKWQKDMAGVRSLKIDLQATDETAVFHSLGVAPRLDVTLVDRRRSDSLAWALAIAVFLYGVRLTFTPASRKLRFVIGVGLAATLLPLVTGWYELVDVVNPSFYAACWLLPYYATARITCAIYGSLRPTVSPATVAVPLLIAFFGSSFLDAVAAVEPSAQPAPVVVQIAPPAPPVQVPDDALILLYQPTKEPGAPKAEQMLVPYDRYQELWNRANPDERLEKRPPPASYAPAGAAFTAVLDGKDFIEVRGRLEYDLFVDEFVQIPLALAGGVLAEAKLDGKPARLNIVRPEAANPPTQQAAQAMSKPVADPTALLVLVASGKGRHQLDLSIRLSLQQAGGWRMAAGRLPAAGAAGLTLTVPQAATDVRLENIPDRRNYTTTRAGETIATALGPNGDVRIQWRPKINVGQIDQTLKARSDVMLAVQEDGLRMAWLTQLQFSGAPRETFTVAVPSDYLVERVTGDNVRNWEPRDDGGQRKLDITLLQAATDDERFIIYLSRRTKLGEAASEFTVPIVGVEGAAVQSGQITLQRSRVLDLRTVEAAGLTRVDLPPDGELIAASAEPADVSPLGMRPFQTYRFAAPSFSLKLAVEPAATKATAELRTIVRIAERERRLESQLIVRVSGPSLHRLQVYIPDDLQLDQVSVPGAFEWAVTTQAGRRLLSIYFAAGQAETVNVVLAGMLGKPGPLDVVPLPRLEVLDVERQQGDLLVQVDPAFNVEATDLRGCERELLDRTFGWLQAAQRPLARLALRHTSGDYGGNLKLTVRKPSLHCRTVTNVRVTDRTIEETILLDFTIRDAGVREVAFLLPAALRDARISVPQLRQQTIEPVGDDGRLVRVRLQLQDEVMGQLRVLVENDRARSADVQEVPLPTIETGESDGRFIALESSGRDEVTVEQAVGLEALSRRQQQWQVIAGLLSGGSTQAFRVEPNAAAPRLTYVAQSRTTVETVGARIGLAEATLVFDASGAYRAVQSYRLDNKTEQFLTVELPAGAALWTVWAAGEPVKPTRAPPPASDREVRIPLLKTAEGDLDYEVRLVYGGKLPSLETLRRVSFPLMRTVNVKVELSQVRLYLPEAYRWFNFDGTMKLVVDEAELQAGNLSYYNKSTEKLAKTLEGGDEFAKVRASNSLQLLKSDVQSYLGTIASSSQDGANENLQRELTLNGGVWREAEQQRQAQVAQQSAHADSAAAVTLDNSTRLNEAFEGQQNARAKNVVSGLTFNFSSSPNGNATVTSSGTLAVDGTGQFDAGWLNGNRLATDGKKPLQENGRVQQAGQSLNLNQLYVQNGQNAQPAAPQVPLTKSGEGKFSLPQSERDAQKLNDADVVQRYQRRLEEQSKQQGDFKRSPSLDGPAPPSSRPTASQPVDVSAANAFGAAAPKMTGANTYSGGTTIAAGALITAPTPAGDFNSPPADGLGLVGLDVQIPQRGVLYRFTTPLGQPEVSAMPVAAPLLQGLQRLLGVLVALVALRIVWRFFADGRHTTLIGSRSGALLLTAAGLLSMVLWMLPLMGALLFGLGIVLLLRRLFVPAAASR